MRKFLIFVLWFALGAAFANSLKAQEYTVRQWLNLYMAGERSEIYARGMLEGAVQADLRHGYHCVVIVEGKKFGEWVFERIKDHYLKDQSIGEVDFYVYISGFARGIDTAKGDCPAVRNSLENFRSTQVTLDNMKWIKQGLQNMRKPKPATRQQRVERYRNQLLGE